LTETILEIDSGRQRSAKEYARIRHRLLAANLTLVVIAILVLLLTGLSAWLRDAVEGVAANEFTATALYFAVLLFAYEVAFFPLSYFSGFHLPHRYGLSTQTLRGWLVDQGKGFLVGLGLGGVAIEVIYFLLRGSPSWWWLWSAGFLLLFSVVISTLAPVLLMPIFYKLVPLEDEGLASRLVDLAQRAGTKVVGAFTMDMSSRTTAANAGLMGMGSTRRIVVGDTMLDNYSPDEIETVLAHELGHHTHNDIWKGIAVEVVLTTIGLYLASRLVAWGVRALGFDGPADLAAFPLLALALGLYNFIVMPLGNAYSRWRERVADDYALNLTGKPDAFASAMIKLANQNLADVDPEPWVVFLLHSHPPIGQRIANARRHRPNLKLEVRVSREVGSGDLPLPSYASSGSTGMDLRAAIDGPITLRPGGRALVPTGLRIALPQGYEAQIRPRSGLALSAGLVIPNAPGTVDADYRGEIKVILMNLGDAPFTVQRGDRIAQMVVAPVARVQWEEAKSLDSTDRGEGGFGHSGIGDVGRPETRSPSCGGK